MSCEFYNKRAIILYMRKYWSLLSSLSNVREKSDYHSIAERGKHGTMIDENPTLEKLHEQTFKSFESIYHIEFEKQKNKECKGFKQPDLCSRR